MTRWTGTSGLILAVSPPSLAIASRIAARSTTQGTPVKSCSSTRAGRYWISRAGRGVLLPVDQRLDVAGRDGEAAVLEAQQVLEQDLHRERQAAERRRSSRPPCSASNRRSPCRRPSSVLRVPSVSCPTWVMRAPILLGWPLHRLAGGSGGKLAPHLRARRASGQGSRCDACESGRLASRGGAARRRLARARGGLARGWRSSSRRRSAPRPASWPAETGSREAQPAEQRRPEEAGIFERHQRLRLGAGIAPAQQQRARSPAARRRRCRSTAAQFGPGAGTTARSQARTQARTAFWNSAISAGLAISACWRWSTRFQA